MWFNTKSACNHKNLHAGLANLEFRIRNPPVVAVQINIAEITRLKPLVSEYFARFFGIPGIFFPVFYGTTSGKARSEMVISSGRCPASSPSV
jgi:hypothetical protein